MSHQWNDIGRDLGVALGFRQGLQADQSRSNDDKLEIIIAKWKESQCSEVSWKNLMEVLATLEYYETAGEVKTLPPTASQRTKVNSFN